MGKKELVTIAAIIVTCTSALFGAMSYVEARFIDKDEFQAHISQLMSKLNRIEDRLQSIEEAIRTK